MNPTWLNSLADDTPISITVGAGEMTMGEVRQALAADERPIYVTTERAAEMFGWTASWWRAAAPSIPGAIKDRFWHLPVDGCEQHIASRSIPRRRRRGPWFPKAESAPAPRSGSEDRKAG